MTLGIPAIASAHVLEIDGTVGAVLHISPDDNPTADSPTDYILSFSDSSGTFDLHRCDCDVSVILDGKIVVTDLLAATSDTVSENSYTFTRPGVYTLQVTGTPRQPGAFRPFTLNYDVRVTDGTSTMQSMPLLLWLGMGLGVGLILLAAYAMDDEGPKGGKHAKK